MNASCPGSVAGTREPSWGSGVEVGARSHSGSSSEQEAIFGPGDAVRTEDGARWWERTSSVVDDQSASSSWYSLGECLQESCCAIVPEDQDITIQLLQGIRKVKRPFWGRRVYDKRYKST